MPKTDTKNEGACRRRGRPVGKNRIPLSLTERRARNAQYERQRRNETSDAMAQLAEAAGFDISMSNGELLASVVARLQKAATRQPSEDIETLRRCNENLLQQIAELEQRLGWTDVKDDKENQNTYNDSAKADNKKFRTEDTFQRRNVQQTNSNVKKQESLNPQTELDVLKRRTFKLNSGNQESSEYFLHNNIST